ncbi:hypothetical protein N825_37560 [Skermanella stibiiresistens SB22]|uniref:Uncharacterized protein n=1 Tax=Skermanella stibiiresistens SB22 TaxID=1385369 RepID=W9GSQ2_9PROT|nr:hypothetical protein N825_37560 [Skermanella stibiiresistens SB22]
MSSIQTRLPPRQPHSYFCTKVAQPDFLFACYSDPVTESVTCQRLASRQERVASVLAAPSRRRLAILLTGEPADGTSEERLYLERLFSISLEIAVLHDLAQRFGRRVRQHGADDLTPWLAEALESDLRPFAEGLRQDLAAVFAALATPWSNGQTVGRLPA